jgi:hypothetical protein
MNSQGKFLTLWLSRSIVNQPSQSTIIPQNDTFLSPPQSSSSQPISNPATINENTIPYQSTSTITFDDILMPPIENNIDDDEDQFWTSLTGESSIPTVTEDITTTTNDTVSDLYLTLLHSTGKDSSATKSRSEHDRTVNSLATDILWPLIVDQTNRRSEKKSSASSTTTTRTLSSNSSTTSSTIGQKRICKRLSTTVKSRRTQPYTTA